MTTTNAPPLSYFVPAVDALDEALAYLRLAAACHWVSDIASIYVRRVEDAEAVVRAVQARAREAEHALAQLGARP